MTIENALSVLLEAYKRLGPDACLILSLTDSELPDADVQSMHIVQAAPDSRYVEVRVTHPDLTTHNPTR